jgi:hypothetical protein
MTQRHVAIGSEFFAKARNDYDDWIWALVREFKQNSIDCGSKNINVRCAHRSGTTTLAVENDGHSMSQEVLVDKLLSLGGSGKNFKQGSTGGFGKAKEILYFCHKSYQIESGDLKVTGNGAVYELTTGNQHLGGTRSIIEIDGDHEQDIVDALRKFAKYSQWNGNLFITQGDGHQEQMFCDLRKGSSRRDLGFGKVYTNRSHSYRLVIRMNGIPMFTYPTGFDRCVVVELAGQSDDVLTSNRDGLRQPYKQELSDFITELSVDKRSALKARSIPRYVHYSGSKLAHYNRLDVANVVAGSASVELLSDVESKPSDVPIRGVDVDGNSVIQASVESAGSTNRWGSSAKDYSTSAYAPEVPDRVVTLGTDFILKNETSLRVPAHFDPASERFSSYSEKLVRIWGRLVLEMHRLFDHEASFSVGFLFDSGDIGATEAQFEKGDFGVVYYLNPVQVVEQKYTYSKSFKKRFKLTERDRLISIAAHEFVHGLGYGWHDERYANKLTDVLAKVMKHRKRFNWCFK